MPTVYELRKWSVMVRRKAKGCKICGARWGQDAHHLYDKSTYPELALDLDNGVSLCGDFNVDRNGCHQVFHNDFNGGCKNSCTKGDFEDFKTVVIWSQSL